MRIFYCLGDYVSFQSSGRAYMDCLKLLGCEVCVDPGDLAHCDCAVLHADPVAFERMYAAYPLLRKKPVVGYAVWEGSRLAEEFLTGLRLVDAVWTCSHFSRQSMAAFFPEAEVLPHVVERRAVPAAAIAEARALLGGVPSDAVLFFSIIDAINPRKNVRDLLFAFSRAREESRRPLCLVLKQYRTVMDFSSIPGVYSIEGDLADDVVRALHMLCHAYVSAHHAEGWGLGLSEAMAYGKPVIATGYSGNMDFMTAENSFPLPYTLVSVGEEMCRRLPWFRPDMVWADVDKAALVRTIKDVAEGRFDPDISRRASEISRTFGRKAVADIMAQLLRKLMTGVAHA